MQVCTLQCTNVITLKINQEWLFCFKVKNPKKKRKKAEINENGLTKENQKENRKFPSKRSTLYENCCMHGDFARQKSISLFSFTIFGSILLKKQILSETKIIRTPPIIVVRSSYLFSS